MNPADVATIERAYGGGYPQVAYFYDANSNLEYVGIGDWQATTAQYKWRVFKLTYNANGLIATQKSTKRNQQLDDRENLTYE